MLGNRFFGRRYFGDAYFPPGEVAVPVETKGARPQRIPISIAGPRLNILETPVVFPVSLVAESVTVYNSQALLTAEVPIALMTSSFEYQSAAVLGVVTARERALETELREAEEEWLLGLR